MRTVEKKIGVLLFARVFLFNFVASGVFMVS